jgi:P4 family phage/plasmid primase-like protien
LRQDELERYFTGQPLNIGVILGDEHGSADVDLDCNEAVAIAPLFLPETNLIFGRPSRPSSHYFYRVDPPIPLRKFIDPLEPNEDEATIIELRCRKKDGTVGFQTVVPHSTHESGEPIRFEPGRDGYAATVAADILQRAVGRIAAGCLLARYWPKPKAGRNDAFLAVAGILARADWALDEAIDFNFGIYRVFWNTQADHAACASEVRPTFEKHGAVAETTGIPKLKTLIDERVVRAALDWLEIGTAHSKLRDTSAEVVDKAVKVFNGAAPDDEAESPAAREERPHAGPIADLLHQPYTDSGNAERLVLLHGRDIRFCLEMKKWLFWDGRRWNTGDTRRVKMLAKRTMRMMYAQAAGIADLEMRKAAERHARASESAKGINAMLACAEYEEGVSVSANDLDQDAFLLNFLNYTLDLKTLEKWSHRRANLITKLVHFNYNPSAACRAFLQFMHKIMGGGKRAVSMAGYLQKCFGYALTGDVCEKAVFCFFDVKGDGNNGKTTLLEIIRFVIREYSAQVLIDTLMAHHSRESNASLSDMADLMGNRFVTTSEGEEGQRLAVGKLKYLSAGMGGIKTCRKWENPITFLATHKIFLDSNHKPVVRGSEKAVWNRLKPVPFTVTIKKNEMDKGLLEKLKVEGEGILAWLVQGCKRWQNEGLGDAPEVTEASAAWQAESDRFPVFLEDRCIVAPEGWVPVPLPWGSYQKWCEVNNEKFSLSKTAFDERLQALGCRQGKRENGTVRAWIGIRFRTPDDDRKDAQRDNGTQQDAKCG